MTQCSGGIWIINVQQAASLPFADLGTLGSLGRLFNFFYFKYYPIRGTVARSWCSLCMDSPAYRTNAGSKWNFAKSNQIKQSLRYF